VNYDSDADPTMQIAKIGEISNQVDNLVHEYLSDRIQAASARLKDSDMPLLIINRDGSCFLNASLQILLGIPGIECFTLNLQLPSQIL
jgi:ubiquitin C-terminal hydrolase